MRLRLRLQLQLQLRFRVPHQLEIRFRFQQQLELPLQLRSRLRFLLRFGVGQEWPAGIALQRSRQDALLAEPGVTCSAGVVPGSPDSESAASRISKPGSAKSGISRPGGVALGRTRSGAVTFRFSNSSIAFSKLSGPKLSGPKLLGSKTADFARLGARAITSRLSGSGGVACCWLARVIGQSKSRPLQLTPSQQMLTNKLTINHLYCKLRAP